MGSEQPHQNPVPVLNVHGGMISLAQGKEQLNRLYSSKSDLYKALTEILVSHSERRLIFIYFFSTFASPREVSVL
jgi:hypothetical protein